MGLRELAGRDPKDARELCDAHAVPWPPGAWALPHGTAMRLTAPLSRCDMDWSRDSPNAL